MKTILIIEDNEQITKIYKDTLIAAGYTVALASTGNQAFALFATSKPNLVILDIMLSQGLNGFDVLERMKKDPALKQIPVIVLTNLDSERKVAMEIGAAAYFIKADTTLEQVMSAVKQYIQ